VKINKITLIALSVALVFSGSCGDKKTDGGIATAEFLPQEFPGFQIVRTSDVRTYIGKSLWEYINGGAELYHLYNFQEVATADYRKNQIEIVADVYNFASEDDAYGMYSMIRSPDVESIRLGVEGFMAPASLNFVRGKFLVRLTGFDESSEGGLLLVELGEEMNRLLPGTTARPRSFSLFPADSSIAGTDKYYTESFLGHKFLTQVYCRDYRVNGDSVTLFLSEDETGKKFLEWSELADRTDKKLPAPEGLPFDNNLSFLFNDSFYGKVMIGLKASQIVGLVGYSAKQKDYFEQWLNSLQ